MTLEFALKCRVQEVGMMRRSTAAVRLLPRVRAVRQKIEADADAAEGAAWTQHRATGVMTQAVARAPGQWPR
jgi:hypothetical protein